MKKAGSLPAGYRLTALDEVTSTNQLALDRIRAGEGRDGDIILARRQTAGRGRQGRDWQSPDGNLFMTIIVRHQGPLDEAAQLSFVAALSVRDAIATKAGDNPAIVTCKWPNDVLIGGKKAAGILLEVGQFDQDGAWAEIALGIGINLSHGPTEPRYPATSLKDALSVEIDADTMLRDLVTAFDYWRPRWRDEGFASVRQAWLQCAHGVGRSVSVRAGDREIEGRFDGLDETGALLLTMEKGTLAVTAGDVHFPDPSATAQS